MWENTAAEVVWNQIKDELKRKGKLSLIEVCEILKVSDMNWVRTVMLEIGRTKEGVRFAFGSLELEELEELEENAHVCD